MRCAQADLLRQKWYAVCPNWNQVAKEDPDRIPVLMELQRVRNPDYMQPYIDLVEHVQSCAICAFIHNIDGVGRSDHDHPRSIGYSPAGISDPAGSGPGPAIGRRAKSIRRGGIPGNKRIGARGGAGADHGSESLPDLGISGVPV